MSKHSMQDCIEKAEKQLREANNNSSIEIMSDLAWSASDENYYREMSIDLEFYNIKKNGQFSKKLKKSRMFMTYCPFCGEKNR